MRTAPVPNMVAIPGMNPGIFVLGGGGDAGGSGAGAGKGKGGKQGAGGKNGGKDANGGGKGAGNCGAGSGGGCSNPQHGNKGTAAGDPVDVVTGRVYTTPEIDLALNGPLPLVIERSYSSLAGERDVGLGFGWSHSLAWEVEERRRTVRVYKPDGTFIPAARPAMDEILSVEDGGLLTRHAQGYTLVTADARRYEFSAPEGSSDARDGRFPLQRILDRNSNAIVLDYQRGLLDTITDSAGRTVRVRRGADGRIAAFEVKNAAHQGAWVAFMRYAHDEQGDLVASTDAAGFSSRYTYDDHRMTRHVFPAGLEVVYRYDASGRCVETWGEYPGRVDPSLAGDVPAVLADGSPAKGVFHTRLEYGPDGFTQVVDSRQLRVYTGNEHGTVDKAAWGGGVHTSAYDALGNLTSYTDAENATWQWVRDIEGTVLRTIDPMGAVTEHRHDDRRNLIEMIDPLGGSVRYRHDARGNLLGMESDTGVLVSYRHDDRGLLVEATLPNGGVTRMSYDAMGNRVEIVEPSGVTRRVRYNHLGRVEAMIDERGHERRYVYGPRLEVTAVHLPDGGTTSFAYDPDGHLTRITDADGRSYELLWAGLGVVHELRQPNGTSIRYRYDREGELTQVVNERGEVHHIVRDAASRIVEERTFDGRTLRYDHDAVGRVVRMEGVGNGPIELAYDPCGRIVARSYDDDTREIFEYDACGRLVLAQNEAAACSFTYDGAGRLLRETTATGSETHAVDSAYDALGKRSRRSTSLGYVETIERDAMGQPQRILLGGIDAIEMRWDALGFEIERVLPGGGAVQTKRDPMGRTERRRVLAPGAGPAVGVGEPDWVGAAPLGLTSERVYRYSPAGEVLEAWDERGRSTTFSYDLVGQIVQKSMGPKPLETYAYDAAGALFDRGAGAEPRFYEAGGRLVKKGRVEYVHDEGARLVEKRVAEEDGSVRSWTYTWNGRGLLASVRSPDGSVVDLAYDPFGRRVSKRTRASDGAAGMTRFVWDDDVLVHEIRERAAASGDPIVQQRTYVFQPGTPFPMAHVDAIPDGSRSFAPEWVHYVGDRAEKPSVLVRGDGRVSATLDGSVWGQLDPAAREATPLRYPGQYEDIDLGLVYNRFRYYDADTGRYISADPIGLEGGLQPFGYARNRPLAIIDPEGLDPVEATVGGSSGSHTCGSRESDPSIGGGQNPKLHLIVEQSLPPTVGGKYPGGPDPTSCAEPRALTSYINQWEKDNRGGKPMDPNNPADHDDIKKCMQSIDKVSAKNPAKGTQAEVKRAPCPNCSQLLANLQGKWGGPPTAAIEPGFPALTGKKGAKTGIGAETNFSPPKGNWGAGPADPGPNAGNPLHTGYPLP